MISALVRIDGAVPAADRIDSRCSPYQLFHDEATGGSTAVAVAR